MFVSVLELYQRGTRRHPYDVKIATPVAGRLLIVPPTTTPGDIRREAHLVDGQGKDLLVPIDDLFHVNSELRGMRLFGVVYRQRSAKHTYRDAQACWVRAPAVLAPLVDHESL